MTNGYFDAGRLGRSHVRIHWTTPLGLFVFSGFAVNPGVWLALVGILLVHELGHAAVVRAFRLAVLSVDIHGLGGACRWVGAATPAQEAAIAWGGVLAQLALLVPLQIAISVTRSPIVLGWLGTAGVINVCLIALNLLPVPPLDGAHAWRILLYWRELPRWARRKYLRRETRRLERRLTVLRGGASPESSDTPSNPWMN